MRSLFIVLLFAVSAAWSNPLKVDGVDTQIIFYTFDGQTAKADSLLNLMISKNPDSPKYYALKTPFYFYSRYFGPGGANANDSLRNLILVDGQKAIDLAEKNLDEPESKFYAGLASAFISRVHAMRREYWDAYWAADMAEELFEEVLEQDPGNVDALMASSIREYFVENNLTGFTYASVYALGMSGEKQHALDNIQKVASKGRLFKEEARFALAMINRFFENDLETASNLLNEMAGQYPNNNFIQNQKRQADFMALINEKGTDYLVAEIDTLKETYNIANAGLLNGLGYQFLNQNRMDDAIKVFTANMNLFPDVANCYDSLAEGYMTNGQNDMAIKYYRTAYQKLDADSSINDQFRQTLKDGIETRLEDLGSSINI